MGQGVRVADEEAQVRLRIHLDLDPGQGGPLQEADLVADQVVQVDDQPLGEALPGESQEALDPFAAPGGGPGDEVEGAVGRGSLRVSVQAPLRGA